MSAQPPFSGIPYPQPPFPAYPGGVAGYQVGLHHSQIKAANAYVRATSSGC
jgi:hypothetical protein